MDKVLPKIHFSKGLLVGGEAGSVHYVNEVAWCILNQLIAGVPADAQLTGWFQEAFGVSEDDAKSAIEAVTTWKRTNYDLPANSPALPPRPSLGQGMTFDIFGEKLRLSVEDSALFDLLRPMITHLEAPADAKADREVILAGTAATSLYALYVDGACTDIAPEFFTARHLTLEGLALASRQGKECFALLHAAAASVGGAGVVIFGPSGAGKTTLLLGMLANGGAFIADDLVPLTGRQVEAIPMPFAIGVKSGSWSLAKVLCSEIEAIEEVRLGDRIVKYLPADPHRFSVCLDPQPIKLMIIPHYSPGEAGHMEPLSPLEALTLASEYGSWFNGASDKLRDLAACFETTPAVSIRYGSLDEAMQRIRTLLADLSASGAA